jgi:F-type H+-transporting ATPase subunit delta
MKINKQARRDARNLLRGCLVNAALDADRVRQTVRLMIARKPRGYLSTLTHFQRLLKLEIDRRAASVESAAPLAPELNNQIQAALTRLYGQGLTLTFRENPALLGGLRIKVGSDVFDGSVQCRLAALQESFG